VEAGDCSLEKVLECLRVLQVPPNFTRKNVKHPWLTRLLIGALKVVAPDFPFTSIQLNYKYASRPHVDKNNLGTSFIVGLGDYTGGEMWVHDESGDDKWTLDGEEDVTGYYHVGRELNGRILPIRDTWTIFDGNKLHWTRPFEGERYSIIYFTSDRYAATPEDGRKAMAAAGFDFDFAATDLEAVLQEKHQRRVEIADQVASERADEARRKMLLRGRCIGRVWAAAWGLRCTSICEEGSEFCGSHIQKDRWKTHGRMDGDLPEKKRDEMAWYQKRMVEVGKRPPVREGATILVPIPEWPETGHLREAMKTYGEFRGKTTKPKPSPESK